MTHLVLISEGCHCTTLVYDIGDWVRTRDGRIIEITTWPRIDEPDLAGAREVRQACGNVWKAPEARS